jgi:hypothetical protein
MAEAEGTAGAEVTGEFEAPIDIEAAESLEQVGGSDIKGDGDEAQGAKAPEPPRRRLVSELLEGQEALEDSSRSGIQLVAPPLHLETIDAGQPIYQLDLSSEEPQGVLVEPERPAPAADEDPYDPGAFDGADAHDVIKNMIMQRDRHVMAAERDGIGAYELASGVDAFVRRILEIARRVN